MALRKSKINNKTNTPNTDTKTIDSFFTISQTIQPISNTIPIMDNIPVANTIPIMDNVLVASNMPVVVSNTNYYTPNDIKNRIELLSDDELMEIFKIIKYNNEKYSTNKNGIFINLSILKKSTMLEINKFLYFCDTNNKKINDDELERAKYKEFINDS